MEFVRYDIETVLGRDAWRRCEGTQLPMMVAIDPSGVVRLRKIGSEHTPERFLEFLAETQRVLGRPPS